MHKCTCMNRHIHVHRLHTQETRVYTHRQTHVHTDTTLHTHARAHTHTLLLLYLSALHFSPSTYFMCHPWTRVRLPGFVAGLGHVPPAQAAETECQRRAASAHIDVSQSGGWKSEMAVPAGVLMKTCFWVRCPHLGDRDSQLFFLSLSRPNDL